MTVNVDELKELQPVVMKGLQLVFEKSRIAHAYIFDGEKDAGTIELGTFFIKLLLCEKPANNTPCGGCINCKRIDSGNHPNVKHIYPDGQYIKIDQIRSLISEMTKTGFEEGRKVYVIHDADRMNIAASNTLLKFLEEPEGLITAILLTNNYQSILPTIQSRCQHIKFSSIPKSILRKKLQQQGITESMAATISMVTNNIDTGLQLANDEQFALVRKTVLKLVEAVNRNIHEALLIIYDDWISNFKEKHEIEQALDLLLYAYRDIVAIKANPEALCTFPDMVQVWKSIALTSTYERLSNQMQAILQARQNLEHNMNRTLLMEQLMLKLQEG